MQVLLWTFGLLILFASATYTRFESYKEEKSLLQNYLVKKQEERKAALKARTISFDFLKPKNNDTQDDDDVHTYSTGDKHPSLCLDFPPFNAKLNLAIVLRQQKATPFYALTLRLFQILSDDHPLCISLLDQIIAKSSLYPDEGRVHLKTLSDLGLIVFNAKEEQELFLHLVKNHLFDHLMLEPSRKKYLLNVHYLSYELLLALFQDPLLAKELYQKREALHQEGKFISTKKKRLYTKLYLTREIIEALLILHHKTFVDFEPLIELRIDAPRLSNLSPEFCVTSKDPKTGITSRKKIFN